MLIDGERLKALVSGATRQVILCAPFIKEHAFRVVLDAVPPNVPLAAYTRWRPEEVAAGVSDLAVYDLVTERPAARLFLLNELHAKLYVADDRCLVGSANLTGAALGWSANPNLEILTAMPRADEDVSRLLARLAMGIEATAAIRDDIAAKAALVERPQLEEAKPDAEAIALAGRPWLPKCASPASLYAVYRNPGTTAIVVGTRADALDDLADLGLPPGLEESLFKQFVAEALGQFPGVRSILDRVPAKLTDASAIAILQGLRPDFTEGELVKQWQIVRDWIAFFYAGRFEVAPESFVIRLKS